MMQNIFVVRFYVNLKMNKIAISIAKDFSIHPGGRFKNEGPYSGEEFRELYILPILNQYDNIIINLNGTRGYALSFFDEVFGFLIRENILNKKNFFKKITLISSNLKYINDIKKIIDYAEAQKNERFI